VVEETSIYRIGPKWKSWPLVRILYSVGGTLIRLEGGRESTGTEGKRITVTTLYLFVEPCRIVYMLKRRKALLTKLNYLV